MNEEKKQINPGFEWDLPSLDNYTAIGLAEGFIKPQSKNQVIEAWQHLVDTGIVWSLQGWFGRNAKRLIDSGIIQLPLDKQKK